MLGKCSDSMRKCARVATMLAGLGCVATAVSGQSAFDLSSPNGRVQLKIETSRRLSYSVLFNGKTLVRDATASLTVDKTVLGQDPKVTASPRRTVDQQLVPPVAQKFARIHEHFNELRLDMEGDYSLVFRAYNEGVAYRFETSLPRSEVKVYAEEVNLNFASDYSVYYPREESFFSHNEREFGYVSLKSITPQTLGSVPVVVDASDGIKIAVADADVEDYPGLWFRGSNGSSLTGAFPPYPLKEQLKRDRDLQVTESADYIAITRGKRTYPWRLLGLAENDGDLLTNQLIYLLAKPSQVEDTSWIKPGKVAWDWWNANNVYQVPFKSGVNTQTYKYFIDFASKYGIEYIVLDEGWYKLGSLLDVVPEMNVAELTEYARQKKVGIILWVVWKTLDDQLEPALDQFQKWGVKGIKVDFMQRDDQPVMNFYHRISREAAKRKMLVDFHGAVRPATMTRTWPNLISTEGVRGLEHNKWSKDTTPEHDVTLPFTRMFMGPMDYTPGAMVNAQKASFAQIFEQPMSQGTRCHQLAMYVVYESPLQMLADSPSNYLREPEVMEFLAPVPTVWDDTKVLQARLADYLFVARRSGRDWYLGAMTDWTPRELEADLSFLPAGTFEMEAYQDGVNSDRHGSDYLKVKSRVDRTTKLKIRMAAGGGWAAKLSSVR
jgi:alpha-glucosidase